MTKNKQAKIDQQDIAQLIQDWRENVNDVAAWQKLTRAVVARAPKMQTLTKGTEENIKSLTQVALNAVRYEDDKTYARAQAVILAHIKTYGVAKKMLMYVIGIEKDYRMAAMRVDEMWSHVHPVTMQLCRLAFAQKTLLFKGNLYERVAQRRKAHFGELNR